MGKIALPHRDAMVADSVRWLQREEALADPFEKIDFQADYVKDLMAVTDYPAFNVDLTAKQFKDWEHDKHASIVGYRDKAFRSPVTGTMAPLHETAWLDAMDDSMETFLASHSRARLRSLSRDHNIAR